MFSWIGDDLQFLWFTALFTAVHYITPILSMLIRWWSWPWAVHTMAYDITDSIAWKWMESRASGAYRCRKIIRFKTKRGTLWTSTWLTIYHEMISLPWFQRCILIMPLILIAYSQACPGSGASISQNHTRKGCHWDVRIIQYDKVCSCHDTEIKGNLDGIVMSKTSELILSLYPCIDKSRSAFPCICCCMSSGKSTLWPSVLLKLILPMLRNNGWSKPLLNLWQPRPWQAFQLPRQANFILRPFLLPTTFSLGTSRWS